MYYLADFPYNFNWTMQASIPEGYELVETPEHKKKRLGEKVKTLERQLEYHSREGARIAEELKKLELG